MFDPIALYSGASALGGMLVGGFIVYHKVSAELSEINATIKEIKDEREKAKKEFVTIALCGALRSGCGPKIENHEKRLDEFSKMLAENFKEVFGKLDRVMEQLANKADR